MNLVNKIIPFLISGFFVVLIFGLHYFYPSWLNHQEPPGIDNEHFQGLVENHVDFVVFARRPLTSFSILFLNRLGIEIGVSFVLVNFSLLFLSGLLLYWLARELKLNKTESYFSVIGFYLTFSILFSFIPNVDSYDEPFQYLFIFLTLLAIVKQKYWLFVLGFFLSLVARETTVILFPGYLFLFLKQTWYGNLKLLSKLVLAFLPLLIYLVFIFWFIKFFNLTEETENYFKVSRFAHFEYNFQTWQFAKESVINLFAVLTPGLFLAIYALKNKIIFEHHKIWFYAFFVSAIINTLLVFLTARAREARLFTLPLVFLWPILGTYIKLWWNNFSFKIKKNNRIFLRIILLMLFVVFTYFLSFKFYDPANEQGIIFQIYFFWEVLILGAILLFSL